MRSSRPLVRFHTQAPVESCQKRASEYVVEPFRRADEGEVGERREGRLAVEVVARASVGEPRYGVGVSLRTVVALHLPAAASRVFEVSAVAGEGPAVVEGPHHGAAPFPQIVEQARIVEVISVNVVEVDYVGADRAYALDESLGGFGRAEAVSVCEAGEQTVAAHVGAAADRHEVRLADGYAAAVGHIRFPTVEYGFGTDFLGDFPGGSAVGRYVDL